MTVAAIGFNDSQSNNGTLLGVYQPVGLGVQAGDLLFALTVADASVTVSYNDFIGSQPWTNLHNVTVGAARFGCWTRTAAAGDATGAGSHGAWIASASSHSLMAKLMFYRGGTLVDEQIQTATSAAPTAPSATGPSSTGLLVCMFAGQVGAVSSITLPAGLTARGSSASATGPFFSDVDTEGRSGDVVIGSGATSAQAATSTGGSGPNIGWAITLSNPAVGQWSIGSLRVG